MRKFQFIALTPAGGPDPSIAIAASRAGAVGVLNLEFSQDLAAARRGIADLARYADGACGLKLDSSASALIEALTTSGDLPKHVGVVVLTPWHTKNLSRQVPALRQRGLTVLVEVTSPAQADLARQLGADGLIAKGHESGGWVGDETTFILLQRLISNYSLPVWAYGGIGLHTAAACYVAGAAGVVLDTQLALTRESRLPEAVKTAVAAMDGGETTCLGAELGRALRLYTRPGSAAIQALEATALKLAQDERSDEARLLEWSDAAAAKVGWGSLQENVWVLDQAAAFARPLAERYLTVGGVVGAMREALQTHARAASQLRPLDAASPLALSHNTRYPIVQGPMTRVSDRAEFALRIAEGGGLPFLALALMRAPEVEALLEETKQRLAERSWGVGILGFVPQALRQEQLDVIRKFSPPYALIAGGRPDQARLLENDGIPTYLHVPSPGLLRLFLQDGARRFVFEGRECGGHVGPRSSFALWDMMVDVLLEELPPGEAAQCHVLFAGGIHERRSAAMVATLAAPLAERGVRLGVLMGTAYLFTEELVASGSIVPGFQETALRCDGTVLLESGPGYATRCVPTPFVDLFHREKQRLRQEGRSAEEIRNALEELNIGRLRLASKGITRHPGYRQDPAAPKYVSVGEEAQQREGMYMIGQVAALRHHTCSIADLHHEVAVEGTRLLEALGAELPRSASPPVAKPSRVAIVGMSTHLPRAQDLAAFWFNVLNRVHAITEVPPERWDPDLYYDPDRNATDKIYSKSGGFLDDVPFDPLEFGIPPNSLPSIDPLHLLALVAARDALADAGYAARPFERSRASVILGASGGTGDLGAKYLLRSGLPLLFGEAGFDIARRAQSLLPDWTEDSFPGLLLNVAAGRIANRFDFGGLNYVVDAACASSLAALHLAVKELEAHTTDLVIAGGVDTVQNPFGYLCFSKTQALSPTGQARVFDHAGDGIVISEGVVMLVLKRLADAERDGDRIYAVISGVGGSSDGRALGLTAPRPEGQALALERAYAVSGVPPTTVELFEAHGTGTVVGDRTEATTLSHFLVAHGARPQRHAIGSVKSMIGHTKATAGVAGVVKVACALYHKVLPPTLGVTQPNPKAGFGDGPLYVNSETRPWIHGDQDHPRRAGVSAFGFGGTNFHAVLEEYTGDFLAPEREAVLQRWPSELMLWSAPSRPALLAALEHLEQALAHGARPELRDLAYTLWQTASDRRSDHDLCLAVVTHSLEDLQQKLASVRAALQAAGPVQVQDPRGAYLTEAPLARAGKVAFLFPGQGSQYPNMLRDLAVNFPIVRDTFDQTDRALARKFSRPLSGYVFPPPAFTPDEERAHEQALTQTDVAQPALGAANTALFRLLRSLGVHADLLAGHSYGEYAALSAAGVFDLETLVRLSEARGRSIIEAAQDDLGTMAAVRADANTLAPLLESLGEVWIANLNAPQQTIISGSRGGVATAVQRLQAQGISAQPIAVACAFHSPLMEPAKQRLKEVLSRTPFAAPRLEVFSNAEAAPYPREPEAIRELLTEHLVRPVRFADQIEAMYAVGVRVFVEAGPGRVLTGLATQVLGSRPHTAVAVDVPRRHGLTQLQHALGQLAAQGVAVQLGPLFAGRAARRLNLDALEEETHERPLPPTTWLVNGSRARPLHGAEDKPHRPPMSSVTLGDNGRAQQAAAPSLNRLRDPGSVPLPPQPPRANQTSPSSAPLGGGPASSPNAAPVTSSPGDEVGQVMVQFQQMMEHFLETQRSVMLAYLQEVEGTTPRRDGAPKATASPLPAPSRPEWPMEPSTGSQSPVAPPTPAAVGSHGPDSAAVPDSAARPLPSAEWLTRQLLHIVSERTGYPPEMLDLDVDIEASLGIDSIKRVEILGTLRRECLPADHQIAPGAMEQLTGIKTLRGIIQWLDAALRAGGASEAGEATVQPPEMTVVERSDAPTDPAIASASQDGVPRSTLIAVEAPPLPDLSIHFEPERVFLLTEDGRGIAATLAEEIRRRGGRAVRVGPLEASDPTDEDVVRADIGDPSVASDVVARVREQHGPISGLIHLLPLREVPDLEGMDLAAWRARLRREVKGLVYLAQAAAKDLKRAGETASAWVMAAAFIDGASEGTTGGRLPRWRRASGMALARQEAARLAHFPGHAGVAGLMKTLAQEWPAVACKVVHLDAANSPHDLADQLLREMVADDGLVEVSYLGSQRRCFRPIPAPLDESGPPYLTIESDWVVLVTGGARGITAEVACELAERYRPTLLLVGSSPPPAAEEPAQTAGLTSPQQLKAALVEQMREGGEPVTLAQVEAAYRRLLKEREVRRNLARMREAGARVSYYQVDVRDEQAMAHLVEQAYRRFGRLDGVIHGAGVIEDKLIEDKPPDSFDRVFDTKTDGAFLLGRVLRADSVRFLAFFSSTAGPFGNRGQSDYAAANEVLNGLAAHLDRRWPGRVMSLNWGPWMTGMVSPELQREFARRNIQLLSARQGRAAFDRELRFGRKGEAEIILARGDWGGPSPEGGSAAQPAPPTKENASPPADASDHGRFPLLQHARMSNGNGRLVEAVRALDPSVDLYLADHRLDGKPVFPLAMAMELMAEVVQHGWPDRTVIGLRDLQVLKGVILEDGPEKVRVVARAPTEPLPEPPHVHVPVEILGEESGRVFYRATVELADALPALTPYPPPALDGLQRFPLSVAEAYRQWLFHGPLFQGLSAVEGISPDGLVATCRPSSPQRCLADNAAGQWLIDPMVFDSALQSIILWTRFYLDATPLPSRFNRYRRFGSLSAPEIRCYLQVPAQPGGNLFWVNIAFVAGGDLVGLLEGMECPASKALNRLSERRRRV